jgi:hypothetical protein
MLKIMIKACGELDSIDVSELMNLTLEEVWSQPSP